MRIGIFTHNFPWGVNDRQNAGTFVNDIAQELALKNRVSVYSQNDRLGVEKIGKVNISYFPWVKGKNIGSLKFWNPLDVIRFCLYFISGIGNLKTFIRTNKIEVNLSMWAFPGGVFAYLCKKLYKIPYVVWCLGSDIYIYSRYPVINSLIKKILRSADLLLADGFDLAKRVTNISGRKCLFLSSASKVMCPGVPVTKTKPEKLRLLMVGRMEKIKGPDIMLDALFKLGQNINKYEVHFVGDGALLEELQNKVEKSGHKQEIIFHGNINSFKEIGTIMRQFDWLVIPSLSDSIPLVFSEAMKCGLPVIVSDLSDLKYLVGHYHVGLVFKKGNVNSLANLLSKLPLLMDKRKYFVNNTSEVALSFSVEESAKKLFDLLSAI